MIDAEGLKSSWAAVVTHGEQVPLRFYSRLFVTAPETRSLFPLSMATQRDRFVIALGRTIAHIDNLERLKPHLEQLGRNHRRFGVLPEHYRPVGETLLATLADFLGEAWTPELAETWENAYQVVASIMISAAHQDAQDSAPWCPAELVAHQRRSFDIAVLTVKPERPQTYVAGQSMEVEVPQRPGHRRFYSPANAPRQDGHIDLHVRRTPGGCVSTVLVDVADKGDVLNLGPAMGNRLTLHPGSHRDLLLIAGGTGLAPLKALAEQALGQAAGRASRRVVLFFGVCTARELYDLDDLHQMETRHPELTVIPTITDDAPPHGVLAPGAADHRVEQGPVGEVALRHGNWHDHDIYICGSDTMVQATDKLLRDTGHPVERIFYEGFQSLGGSTYGVIGTGGR